MLLVSMGNHMPVDRPVQGIADRQEGPVKLLNMHMQHKQDTS
jgi:hypothetical protein